jgi:NAD(P)-dependent dehydrogenase (short-subunit alcohol dehydrogenase family)
MVIRALVVGGTSGIGYAMACRLAQQNPSANITISGRNKPTNIEHKNITFRALDASSMRAITSYTDLFKQENPEKLDYLIMTQGIMTTAGRTEVGDEHIDRKMALHYYGKQLLIRELMPVLADDAKVIIVLDSRFGDPKKFDWDDMDLKKNFTLGRAATHCTVMNDVMVQTFAAEQARKQGSSGTGPKRHFLHAFPGGVNTNLLREFPWVVRAPMGALGKILLTSPATCAQRLLDGTNARAAEGEKIGRFWANIGHKGELVSNKTVFTEEEMQKVADHTWSLVDAAIGK